MTRICSIDGCGKPLSAHGFCTTHDRRRKLYGDPMTDIPVAGRGSNAWLLDHVSHQSLDCLTWPFGKAQNGYGKVTAKIGGKVYRYAHIAMCVLKRGPMPEPGMLATHSCGNGHLGCVNPNHLRWGTHASNSKDTVSHGRTNRGERSPVSKLKEEDVILIRKLIETQSNASIARRFGVDPSSISLIRAGKSWRWLS